MVVFFYITKLIQKTEISKFILWYFDFNFVVFVFKRARFDNCVEAFILRVDIEVFGQLDREQSIICSRACVSFSAS